MSSRPSLNFSESFTVEILQQLIPQKSSNQKLGNVRITNVLFCFSLSLHKHCKWHLQFPLSECTDHTLLVKQQLVSAYFILTIQRIHTHPFLHVILDMTILTSSRAPNSPTTAFQFFLNVNRFIHTSSLCSMR